MFKLLLVLITTASSFGVYEFEQAVEKEKAQHEVTKLIIQEEFEKECFIKVKEAVATIIEEETEEFFEKKNIKLIMNEFFQRKEFEGFEKKNQQTNKDILSRLRDLEERDRLRNEELIKLQKDNEQKNENILNLQNKVDKLENELFKKFDAFSDEILEKVVPIKEENEETKQAIRKKIQNINWGGINVLDEQTTELILEPLLKIKDKKRLQLLSDAYDNIFFIDENGNFNTCKTGHHISGTYSDVQFKSSSMYYLSKVKESDLDKFCQIVDDINKKCDRIKPAYVKTINQQNLKTYCNFEVSKLEILGKMLVKLLPANFDQCERLILFAKKNTINDLIEIESKIPDFYNPLITTGIYGQDIKNQQIHQAKRTEDAEKFKSFNIWLDSVNLGFVDHDNNPDFSKYDYNNLHGTKYTQYIRQNSHAKIVLDFTDIIKSFK